MKKCLLILSSILFAGGLNAQTYLTLKDFQDQSITSQGWQSYVVTSTPNPHDWITQDLGSTGNFYAMASGYTGGADDTELWLISASMDLTSATLPILNFRNATNYNGPALALMISSDYDGTSNPSLQGTWIDITGSANWSGGTWAWVNGGPVDLSAYNGNSSVYIAFVYTSSTTAGAATWEIDEVKVAEPPTPIVLPIYDVQNSVDVSPYKDSLVTVGGIVTGKPLNGAGYFIQEGSGPFTGLAITDTVGATLVNRGDSVIVTGVIKEYFGFTTMYPVQARTIVSSGNPEPAAPNVTTAAANGEEWESTLVQVGAANCLFDNDGFGQWGLNDGSDTILIGNLMYAYPNPLVSNIYWVTGVGYYSYSEFKVCPRDINDVQNVTGLDEMTVSSKVYPNPSNGVVNFDNPSNSPVEIYNTLGELVLTTSNSTANLKNGVYLIKIGNKTTRVVVM